MWARTAAALYRPGPVTRFPRLVPATTIHYTIHHTTTLHHWGWAGTCILVTEWFPPVNTLLRYDMVGKYEDPISILQ